MASEKATAMPTEPRTSVATQLAIDSDLVALAMEVGGELTKKATFTKALQELIKRVNFTHRVILAL